MQMKEASGAKEFQENSKEYFINILGGRRKLHRRDGCPNTKCVHKYYDFDTYDEAKASGIPHTDCGHCFRKEK